MNRGFLLTSTRVRLNRVALCQRFNPFLGGFTFHRYSGPCPAASPGRAQRRRSERTQGGITRCGNAHCRRVLTEAAWQYRLKPKVSEAMQKRQEAQSKEVRTLAWKAQQRLHKRFKRLSAKKKSVIAAAAVARELTGFVWAIACQVKPLEQPAAPEIVRTCRGKVYRLDADKTPAKKPETKLEKGK